MKSKGWKVSQVNYDAEQPVYAWRHDVRGGPSPTLRISRQVLETYPAFVLLDHLDELKVACDASTPELSPRGGAEGLDGCPR